MVINYFLPRDIDEYVHHILYLSSIYILYSNLNLPFHVVINYFLPRDIDKYVHHILNLSIFCILP